MNDFKKLQEKIQQLNVFVKEILKEEHWYTMRFGEAISKKDILDFEKISKVKLPESLEIFYSMFGSLHTEVCVEVYSISLPNISWIVERMQEDNYYARLKSIGLIDWISMAWGNDRYEFNPGEYFTKEELDTLNDKYKCFGLYRIDMGFEAASYLYYDQEGNFGELYYDQDRFDDVAKELLTMLKQSPANLSLEQLLIKAVQSIQEGLEEKLKEDLKWL